MTTMSGPGPGSDQKVDLRVVRDDVATSPRPGGSVPEQAVGLLDHARRVADSTVAEARDEAERLLAAARERAQQVQRDARELGLRLRADAERDSAQVRHAAFGEAERIVADARAQVTRLQDSVGGLRSARDEAVTVVRGLVDRLTGTLDDLSATRDGDGSEAGGTRRARDVSPPPSSGDPYSS